MSSYKIKIQEVKPRGISPLGLAVAKCMLYASNLRFGKLERAAAFLRNSPSSLCILILALILLPRASFAQPKFDNVWVIGHGGEGMIFNFSNDTLDTDSAAIEMHHYSANASICDSLGNLLFYTNGGYIANANNEIMENSDMDMGIISEDFPYGPNTPQCVLILPDPGSPSQYYLFYKALTTDQNGMNPESHFYYLLIDMTLNGGLGEIVEKDVLLLDGVYLDWGKITACRHANGRDWWILQGESDSKNFHRFLLSPNGITKDGEQEVDIVVHLGLGQAVFSPNGVSYATLNNISWSIGSYVDIYDFDRCSGMLNNQLQFNFADSAFGGGVAFSPNSRFLYVSSLNYLYQYDMEASDIIASKEVVGIFDGTVAPWFYASFYLCQLAPDGRIYICAPNGVDVMHVINNPDEKGLACNFQQHAIQLPTYNAFSMPNFPNFRLGKLAGSPCDTIGVSAVKEPASKGSITLSPNPAQGFVNIYFPDNSQNATLTLHTATAQPIHTQRITYGWNLVPLQDIAPGLYFYEVRDEGRVLKTGKLVKVE